MATLKASSDPTPLDLAFEYILSPSGRDEYILETGEFPPDRFTFEIPLAELPRNLRPRALDLWRKQHDPKYIADVPPFFEALIPAEDKYPQLDARIEDPEPIVAAWEAMYAKWDAKIAEDQQHKKAQELEDKEASARFIHEMRGWIAANGSDRLKTALARDYKVSGTYIQERIAQEFPRYVLDATNKAKWQERTNPSELALEVESETIAKVQTLGANYKIRIVWLTRDLQGTTLKQPERREAVIVPRYLGIRQYTLVCDVNAMPT